MGKTIKEFKAAVNKIDSEIKKEVNDVAQATGMDETLKDLKQAEQSLKGIDKKLQQKTLFHQSCGMYHHPLFVMYVALHGIYLKTRCF